MIERFIFEELIELLEEFPAIALVGPRQVGKTTLAKRIGKQLKQEVVYIDLENPRDDLKMSDPLLFFESNMDKCIIIDEVQRRKELFPILRSVIDADRKPARFILLGSASPDLIRDSSESLAGRIIYKELTPFNILEVKKIFGVKELLVRGGFPNSLMAKSDKMSILWRSSFVQTYIEKDLPLLGMPVSPSESRRLFRMIAHLQGQLVNYASLSKSLGVSSPTIKKYLEFLEQAFIIDLLEPYSGNTSKRIRKSPKLYFRDTGLLNYLNGLSDYQSLFSYPNVGAIWEGFVINQIKSVLTFDVDYCYYRTQHGAEIDLIVTISNSKRIGVEMKFSSSPTLTRGNYEAMEDLQLEKLYIIIPTDDRFLLKEKVEVIGIQAFLENMLST